MQWRACMTRRGIRFRTDAAWLHTTILRLAPRNGALHQNTVVYERVCITKRWSQDLHPSIYDVTETRRLLEYTFGMCRCGLKIGRYHDCCDLFGLDLHFHLQDLLRRVCAYTCIGVQWCTIEEELDMVGRNRQVIAKISSTTTINYYETQFWTKLHEHNIEPIGNAVYQRKHRIVNW
jgi:hypothetical protein